MNDKKIYYIIGLMSGTSLDGLDIAYCRFERINEKWKYEIIHATTYEYSSFWKKNLKEIHTFSAEDICKYDFMLGDLFGQKVNDFISFHNIQNVDFIASHGHTVFHNPPFYTLQIGKGTSIRAVTNHPVIFDFRSLDLALQGQGAPLVPIGDELLFSEYDFCLNLGGISNISYQLMV